MFYVLKFERPLGNPDKRRGQAKYYCGYCDDIRFLQRMKEHRCGYGAAITRAAKEKGIGFTVVLTLANKDRSFERWWKRQKNTPRLLERYIGTNQEQLPW